MWRSKVQEDAFILDEILKRSDYITENCKLTAIQFFLYFKNFFKTSYKGEVVGTLYNQSIPMDEAISFLCSLYPKTFEQCFLYDLSLKGKVKLPCKGEISEFNIMFDSYGSVNKEFIRLFNSLQELPNLSSIVDNPTQMEELSLKLWTISKFLHVGAKQLISRKHNRSNPRFLVHTYPSMAEYKEYTPELCEICWENRDGCKILNQFRKDLEEFRRKQSIVF